jgi:hypothetical protein
MLYYKEQSFSTGASCFLALCCFPMHLIVSSRFATCAFACSAVNDCSLTLSAQNGQLARLPSKTQNSLQEFHFMKRMFIPESWVRCILERNVTTLRSAWLQSWVQQPMACSFSQPFWRYHHLTANNRRVSIFPGNCDMAHLSGEHNLPT